ncbi:FMN-linked oxidoreductase [Sparassis crispa]|uniref:FMN-linked oxidoreductase n=1 Tax=Sparassis crispa TaxID=139825 RepID=A0A401GQF0_9APHY|nr:FMN-linked oxidoreductase [Sparassis crispa]GBE83974.1 FMN-linked oxidoreductase [Sparassis crispa]
MDENVRNGNFSHLPSQEELFSPIRLPCGRTVQNRFVKVSLYEHMSALFGGPPNAAHFELYSRWSQGRWGMIMTGNVQVARDHLTLGRDLVIPEHISPETLKPFERLANIIHGGSGKGSDGRQSTASLAIMQLSHAGRQSPNFLGGRWPFNPPFGPSAVPVGRRGISRGEHTTTFSRFLHNICFQTPTVMSLSDIDDAVASFVRGAQVAAQSGFDGVELHASHGYLIAQFISPKTNLRSDAYSEPLHFLYHIVSSIRSPGMVPDNFILGIKLNASDYVEESSNGTEDEQAYSRTGMQETLALEHVKEIARWSMVDFIQVSGGDYEHPDFMSVRSGSQRQGLFAHFSRNAVRALTSQSLDTQDSTRNEEAGSSTAPPKPPPLVLLTGGLRSLPLLSSALSQKHAHLLGLGRLSILYPELPRTLAEALKNGDNTLLMESPPEPDIHGLGRRKVELGDHIARVFLSFLMWLWTLFPFEFPRLVGAGTTMAWYIVMLRRIAGGREPDYSVGGLSAVLRMWLWFAPDGEAGSTTTNSILDSWIVMGLIGLVIGLAVGNIV